jgi:predicted transcriptional regulator
MVFFGGFQCGRVVSVLDWRIDIFRRDGKIAIIFLNKQTSQLWICVQDMVIGNIVEWDFLESLLNEAKPMQDHLVVIDKLCVPSVIDSQSPHHMQPLVI